MICTTLANGESALDMTWFRDNPGARPDLHQIIRFNKVINTLSSEDAVSYTQPLSKYLVFYGYVVRENNERANVLVSKTGHSDFYDLYVTKNWVMLVYKKDDGKGNSIYVEPGAKMNFDFKLVTPLGYMASPMSKVVGSPSTSYLINNGNLYEIFESSGLGMIDADYQIYSGMSLVAAFGVKAGSLGLKYWPMSKRAALNLFTNKSMNDKHFVDLPGTYGIYFTSAKRSSAEEVIQLIQNGIRVPTPEWCKVYPCPDSMARSTAAVPSFVCRFAGVKPQRMLGSGDMEDVPFSEVIFDTATVGDGIRAWVNGSDVWNVATYYVTTLGDVADILASYKQFMADAFAAQASAMTTAFNTAISEIDQKITSNSISTKRMLRLSRAQFLSEMKKRISHEEFSDEQVIGNLTDTVEIDFNVPVESMFPLIGSSVKINDINQILSTIADEAPGLLNYATLLSVEIEKAGSKSVKPLSEIKQSDLNGASAARFVLTEDTLAAFADYLTGDGSDTVPGRMLKIALDQCACLLEDNANQVNSGVKPTSTSGEWVRRTYTYGCGPKEAEVWKGSWLGKDGLTGESLAQKRRVDSAEQIPYIAYDFPVNHKYNANNLYYRCLLKAGYTEDEINGATWGKAWDFAVKRVSLSNVNFLDNKRLSPAASVNVRIDDFRVEQVAASLGPTVDGKDPVKAFLEGHWGTFAGSGKAQVVGAGAFALDTCTRTIKTGYCFWEKSDFGNIPVNAKDGERASPSYIVDITVRENDKNGKYDVLSSLNGMANHFKLTDTRVFGYVGTAITNAVNAQGLAYLLKRLADYGDLKNCKTLVEAANGYLTPGMAKYFTRLSIDENGASVIKDTVAALLAARVPDSSGHETSEQLIADPDVRAGLVQIRDDFLELTLSQAEEKPWYASSDQIKTRAGVINLNALGLYLYL